MKNTGTERAREPVLREMTSLGGDTYIVMKDESQPCRVRWRREEGN